jgi:hypothetical protein
VAAGLPVRVLLGPDVPSNADRNRLENRALQLYALPRRNLLADTRITTQPGPLVSNIHDQQLQNLVSGFNQRIAGILDGTDAQLDADWLT